MSDQMTMLECTHEFNTEPPPLLGDTVICLRCNSARAVVQTISEIRTRCTACTYGRPYGRNKVLAQMHAVKHSTNKGHPVRIYDGHIMVRLIGEARNQGTLDMVTKLPQDPPF